MRVVVGPRYKYCFRCVCQTVLKRRWFGVNPGGPYGGVPADLDGGSAHQARSVHHGPAALLTEPVGRRHLSVVLGA